MANRSGTIILCGHFGNFELIGAYCGTLAPVDFVVKRLSNPGAEALITRARRAAGVGVIHTGATMRAAYESLRRGHVLAMVGDQDAGRRGIFVPFLGRMASTPSGPARLAVQAGVPILMAFPVRLADGRYRIEVEEPLMPGDARDPDAVRRLTLQHVAVLEKWVRKYPHMWFWLHRRWKTRPPEERKA
jgi:KDO2-lipid IV(A) lauroyltransferase